MSSCYRSLCKSFRNPTLANPLPVLDGPGSDGAGDLLPKMAHQFGTRFVNSWQMEFFIRWYAVLISLINACFALHDLFKRKRILVSTGNGSRISSTFSHNVHMATQIVMLQCNVLAIIGIIKHNCTLLLPYIVIHLVILALELNYLIVGSALGWVFRKPPTASGRGRPAWRSFSTLAFVAFNLLIMIGAKYAISSSTGSHQPHERPGGTTG
ncbi:uncharacterized protein LOC129749840 [Uranotaenia lowii]|uniref:uncharacterized protein LOC129749840 n=1 Tax=Uranotaenia lowii TaxID=190385 RepID=UPI0024783EC9|nr:uncharacterized protein LOC129749840 [Uranotaenia lowii]